MKLKYCLLAILLPLFKANALPVKPLAIGDKVPQVQLNHLINFAYPAAKLSDFKGRLLILDFWSTWCSACVGLFPHLDSLQQQFKNNMQVVLVNTKTAITGDNTTRIKNTLALVKNRTGTFITLPVVYGCTMLDKLFPCQVIPQEVWIRDGKVIAITTAAELTASNIQALLAGQDVTMQQKKDIFNFDADVPLLLNPNNKADSAILQRTLITGNINGLTGGSGMRLKNDKLVGYYVFNSSLYSLTKAVYADVITCADNQIITDCADQDFNVQYGDTAYYTHTYCYDVITPPTDEATVRRFMKDDLKKYFNITVHKEVRKVKCIVITKDSAAVVAVSNKTPQLDLDETTRNKYIYGYTPADDIRLLNLYTLLPVVDETGITQNIDVNLPYNLNDLSALQQAFKQCGLLMQVTEQPLEVMVITDR